MNRQVDWLALTVGRPLRGTDGAFEAVRQVEAGRHGDIDAVTSGNGERDKCYAISTR